MYVYQDDYDSPTMRIEFNEDGAIIHASAYVGLADDMVDVTQKVQKKRNSLLHTKFNMIRRDEAVPRWLESEINRFESWFAEAKEIHRQENKSRHEEWQLRTYLDSERN